MPVYPAIERQRNTEGLVTVEITLNEEGKVTSAKATSGPKSLRQSAEDAVRRSKFKPVVVGDKVVVGSDDGRLYLVSLKDGSELWSYEIGQAVGSSPAVVDGQVIVGSDDGAVYCFGAKK